MAAVLAAAQSRPADEKEAALEEEQNHPAAAVLEVALEEERSRPAAVVLEVAPEEVQSRLLAACQEAVQEGAQSPRAAYSAEDAAGCDIPAAVKSTGLSSHLFSRRHSSALASQEGRCLSHSDCQSTCWRSVRMSAAVVSEIISDG